MQTQYKSTGPVRRKTGTRSSTAARRRAARRRRIQRRNNVVLMGMSIIAIIFFIANSWPTSKKAETINPGIPTAQPTPFVNIPESDDVKKIVVIDPGHGGNDPGCLHGGIMESDLDLAIAKLVRDYLEDLDFKVVMTREDDRYVSIPERIEIGNNSNAGALVSIHLNALDNDTFTEGMETLYNTKANDLNSTLAKYIQNETVITTNAKDRGILSNTGVMIIRELTIPSCLIEVGFLSSTRERELLISPDYQKTAAQGIVNGIVKFFDNHVE